jgi:hypothetical protein
MHFSREVLLKHILDVHSAETYHCEFCNKTFSGLKYGSLIRHHAAHVVIFIYLITLHSIDGCILTSKCS